MISRTVDALIHPFSFSGSLFSAIRNSETISIKRSPPANKRLKQPLLPSTTQYQSGFEVRPSSLGNLGAFANRTLTKGEIILVESPLFCANNLSIHYNFSQLSHEDKKAALRLYASPHFKRGTPRIEMVWHTNCFATIADEAGLFLVASRFNHACSPANNVNYEYDPSRRCLVLRVAVNEIKSGNELFISYGRDRTPRILFLWHGFRCACGACAGLTEEEAELLLQVDW